MVGKGFKKGLDSICILGRGPSLIRCPEKKPEKSEYWGCNDVYKVRELDKLFLIHDVYMIQFNKGKNLIEEVNKKNFPVYTLGAYKEVKNNVLYPMEGVIKEFDIAYFLNTISYMIPLAIMQRPKQISLFGVDMFWGTGTEYMRNGKACLEYWLGVAIGRKIKLNLTRESTLLKRRKRGNFYGMKVTKAEGANQFVLNPVYEWGRPKSALRYKLVKVTNHL